MIECKTQFDGAKIRAAADKGGLAGLYRAAGLLMKIARQKIKYRSRKVSSPGAPPYQHSKGKQSFRHTIQFAVNRQDLSAYVGPQKVSGKVGKDVPRTLEFGGMTGPAANPTWYKVDGVPKSGLDTTSGIAAWLLKEGYGPLFMAGSESGVVNQYFSGRGRYSRRQIADTKKQKPDQWIFRNIQKRKNPGTKKTVYYVTVPIKSPKQAQQAAENIVKHYGYARIKPHYISPRPFMEPSLQDSKNDLAKFFANNIN